jgi:hypothetical protein
VLNMAGAGLDCGLLEPAYQCAPSRSERLCSLFRSGHVGHGETTWDRGERSKNLLVTLRPMCMLDGHAADNCQEVQTHKGKDWRRG